MVAASRERKRRGIVEGRQYRGRTRFVKWISAGRDTARDLHPATTVEMGVFRLGRSGDFRLRRVRRADLLAAAWVLSGAISCLCLLLLGGCTGGAIRSASIDASKAAVPVVVDQSLASFEDAQNREHVEQILATPEMQRAIQETAHAVVLGALAPEATDRMKGVTAEMTDTVTDVLTRDLREKLIPASVEGMRATMRAAFSRDAAQSMAAALREAVDEATRTAMQSAARELPASLAPALRASIVESLGSPDLRQAVAGVASDATRAALVSSRDVLIELHEHDAGVAGPVERLVDRLQRMIMVGIGATFVLGTLLGALLVYALRFRRGSGRGPPASGPLGGDDPREGRPTSRLDPAPTRAS
jgi:hypothetical protein